MSGLFSTDADLIGAYVAFRLGRLLQWFQVEDEMLRMIAGLAILAFLLSACETTQGFGRDLQRAGNWIEETADR
jgi:predicted small secreted protein